MLVRVDLVYNYSIYMSTKYSPQIVTSGLVLCLDAANKVSYPGSGTGWYNLSGTIHSGSLINGPTFNGGNGGSIVFDGVDDYSSVATSGLVSSFISMDIWFNVNSSKQYSALIGSNVTEKYEMLIKAGGAIEVSLSTNNYMQYNNILSLNTWTNIVVTAVSGTQWKMYKNGADLGSPTSYVGTWQVSGASISNFDLGRIRNDVATFAYSGNISIVRIYNRALSATEVLQNYNATKTRFGL
jgi:hypothetical protein